MSKKKVTLFRKFIYVVIALAIFGLGYGFRYRMEVSSSADEITVIGPNQGIENSLSDMDIDDVVGVTLIDSESGFGSFGQFYRNVREDFYTEIHVRISGLPSQVRTLSGEGLTRNIPQSLDLSLARRSFDGLSFDYQNIGQISLELDDDGFLTGRFSTILPPAKDFNNNDVSALADVERVVFDTEVEGAKNIFFDKNADLPQQAREAPSPFLWVVL